MPPPWLLPQAICRCSSLTVPPLTSIVLPLPALPSIRVVVSFARRHGSLRMSCLYGSDAIRSDHEIPLDTILDLFCPHCHGALAGATSCPSCSAPMVPMSVKGGGMLQVCSRRWCKEHRLDINGVNL